MTSEGDPRLTLIYDESRRGLVGQMARLDEVRARAIGILSVASVSASVFGGLSLANNREPSRLTWTAIACFGGLLVAVALVLKPKRGWRNVQDVRRMLHVDLDADRSLDEMLRGLITDGQDDYDRNEDALDSLYLALLAAIAFMSAFVFLILLDLGVN